MKEQCLVLGLHWLAKILPNIELLKSSSRQKTRTARLQSCYAYFTLFFQLSKRRFVPDFHIKMETNCCLTKENSTVCKNIYLICLYQDLFFSWPIDYLFNRQFNSKLVHEPMYRGWVKRRVQAFNVWVECLPFLTSHCFFFVKPMHPNNQRYELFFDKQGKIHCQLHLIRHSQLYGCCNKPHQHKYDCHWQEWKSHVPILLQMQNACRCCQNRWKAKAWGSVWQRQCQL